jgi:hypothetical protein
MGIHADIKKQYESVIKNTRKLLSFSAIYCFQDKMTIRFISENGIVSDEDFVYGDLVFFGGDRLHAGGANKTGKPNFRFLIHVESSNFRFTDDSALVVLDFQHL